MSEDSFNKERLQNETGMESADNNFRAGLYSINHSEITGPYNNIYLPDLKKLANWASFNAIIDIILGALTCFGIVTAIYGVFRIIAGVKLLGAADDLKNAVIFNDSNKISSGFINLARYFKFNGIYLIISIVLTIVIIIAYFIIIIVLLRNSPDIFNELQKYNRDFTF